MIIIAKCTWFWCGVDILQNEKKALAVVITNLEQAMQQHHETIAEFI